MEVRIDDSLKNGSYKECNHCIQVKKTKYCRNTKN